MEAPPHSSSLVPARQLLSFVPRLTASPIADNPDRRLRPSQRTIEAAVLQCDLRGFTTLTEQLAQLGPEGVEELSRSLSGLFGGLTDTVAEHGGDVVSFAGDALLISWPVERDATSASPDPSGAVRRASQCGLALQELLSSDEIALRHNMAMRAGIGVGEFTAMQLGGVRDRWALAIVGDLLAQLGTAQTVSRVGEVTLSPEARSALMGEHLGEIPNTPQAVRAGEFEPLAPQPLKPLDMPEAADESLWSFIPSAVRARLVTGQQHWIGELRRLSVLFIDLPDLTATPELSVAQEMLTELQTVVYRYEGSFDKLSVDEKGVKALSVFGLPPLSHEDDPVRAVLAARDILNRFAELGWTSSIGITTGRAFCGVVGGDNRREYTVHGNMVNLSARLMQAAAGGILCDEETYSATQMRMAFRASRPIAIKGKAEPIIAYSPTGEHADGASAAVAPRGPTAKLVGREAEAQELGQLLTHLDSGRGDVVLIEGEAGIGKSRLLEHLVEGARAQQKVPLTGSGDAIESASPYRAWRRILSEVLRLDALPPDREVRRNHVMDVIASNDELVPLAPLLNSILPLGIPDNEVTKHMDADVRADNIQLLVTHLLQDVAAERPLLLVLDDAQWLDSSSWHLARHVTQGVQPLATVVAMRPVDEPHPPEYRAFLASCAPRSLELGPLSGDDITALVCDVLGVADLPTPVIDLLDEKAEGHPLFSKELAYFLRNEGLLVTTPNTEPGAKPHGVLAAGADLSQVSFPETVQVVVTSRVDRLEASDQLVLKVASVVGRMFRASAVAGTLPSEARIIDVAANLARISESDLIGLEAPGADPSYSFTHAIIQEVAYGLLLFAQRRELHGAIAEWYESVSDEDPDRYVPLLAHHWSMAEDSDKAIRYLGMAGELALASFANEEAIGHLREALDLSTRAGHPVDATVRAKWELSMGQAQVYSSRYAEGRGHLEEALALLGHPVPSTGSALGRAWFMVKALVTQWRNRVFRRRNLVTAGSERERILMASGAYTRLVETAFLSGDQWLALYSAFHALNLAERTDPSPERAEAYGPIGVIWGTIPWRGAAVRYLNRAVTTARQVDSPTALGYALLTNGTHAIGLGDWHTAEAVVHELVDLGKRLGDRKRIDDGMQLLTSIAYSQGQFERCLDLSDELLESASRRHDPRFLAYGNYGKAYASMYLGRLDEATALLDEIPSLLSEESETADRQLQLMYHALLASVNLRLGRSDEAVEAAMAAVERQAGGTLDLGYALPGYAQPAHVLVSLWADDPTNSDLADKARQACRSLKRFARLYEAARPDSRLCLGTVARIEGKERAAVRGWLAAIESAEELGMPLVAAEAHLQMAQHVSGDSAERDQHLTAARDQFIRMGIPDATRPVDSAGDE